jgi:hypothetical protein
VVYPVGLTSFISRWISRTERGPPSHKTCRISNSATVGLGCLDLTDTLLTKYFVNVNENFRQLRATSLRRRPFAHLLGIPVDTSLHGISGRRCSLPRASNVAGSPTLTASYSTTGTVNLASFYFA